MYFNTHTHIHHKKSLPIKTINDENIKNDITMICNVFTSFDDYEQNKNVKYNGNMIFGLGFHPHVCNLATKEQLERMEKSITDDPRIKAVKKSVWIFYRNIVDKNIQTQQFVRQIKIAEKYDYPVIIHARDAENEAKKSVFVKNGFSEKNVQWHCYHGSMELAKEIIEKYPNWYSFLVLSQETMKRFYVILLKFVLLKEC